MRTPMLVRDYLGGVAAYPEDLTGDAAARASVGDYISRTHHRVKLEIKRLQPTYQYPRKHSFLTLVNVLILLGLVERTGQREDPEERGAGQVGVAGGFEKRTFIRLTPGSLGRLEWADPMGHVGLIFKTVRGPDWIPPNAPPNPPAPRERVRPRTSDNQNPDLVDDLEEMRERLVEQAFQAQESFGFDDFQDLLHDATLFLTKVRAVYPTGNPFPKATDAIAILRDCIRVYDLNLSSGGQEDSAATSCQASARLLADALEAPIRGTGAAGSGAAAPEGPQEDTAEPRQRRARNSRPRGGRPDTLPSIDMPGVFTFDAVAGLLEYLSEMADLANRWDWPDEPWPAMSVEVACLVALGQDWVNQAEEALDAENASASPSQARIEDLEERVTQLGEYLSALVEESDLSAARLALEDVNFILDSAAPPNAEPEPKVPQTVQAIFRELVKRAHPDFATGPADEAQRTEFMTRVNRAYQNRDLPLLTSLLAEWTVIEAIQSAAPPAGTPPQPPSRAALLKMEEERRKFHDGLLLAFERQIGNPQSFRNGLPVLEKFLADARAMFGPMVFPDAPAALARYRSCIGGLTNFDGLTTSQKRERLRDCWDAARLLGESIASILAGKGRPIAFEPPSSPTQHPRVPTINLLNKEGDTLKFTLTTVPRLKEHLENLKTLGDEHDWPGLEDPEQTWPEMAAEVERLSHIATEWAETAADVLAEMSEGNAKYDGSSERADQLNTVAEKLDEPDLEGAIEALEEVTKI